MDIKNRNNSRIKSRGKVHFHGTLYTEITNRGDKKAWNQLETRRRNNKCVGRANARGLVEADVPTRFITVKRSNGC